MAFIGTPLDTRNTFQSLAGKRFNGDGSTTAFTLDVAPSSTLDIEVFVGNVRQDPNSAYTLSGTTLTFTGAPPSGTNNIYVVHQAKSVGTIDPPATETVAKQFNGGVVFNEDSADLDFRVESNGNANMLFVDGGNDRVGIGKSSPGSTLHIEDNSNYTLKVSKSGSNIHAAQFASNGTAALGIAVDDSNNLVRINSEGSNDSLVLEVADGTDALVIDSAGHVTKPLQPAFMVQPDATDSFNTTSATDVLFDTEVFDQNADFNTSNYTFTAPVTGRYFLTVSLPVTGASLSDADDRWINIAMETSNRSIKLYQGIPNDSGSGQYHGMTLSFLADMDASDTAKVQIRSPYDATFDINGNAIFSGFLVA